MSPGATFERVYLELKRRLTEGELAPGAPIEPSLIGREIAASITPVRDALHRLVGERQVDAPGHDGFRVPLPTEAALRDLYNWNGLLLGLAVRRIRPSRADSEATRIEHAKNTVAATAGLFIEIARASGSAEHVRAIQQLNDRLAPFRRVEPQLFDDLEIECDLLLQQHVGRNHAQLAKLIAAYHRRRSRAVPDIIGCSTLATAGR